MNLVPGTKVTYDSHAGDSKLNHRTGQTATVVRPLTEDEADLFDVGPMYEVRFDDGEVVNVFEDEIKEGG